MLSADRVSELQDLAFKHQNIDMDSFTKEERKIITNTIKLLGSYRDKIKKLLSIIPVEDEHRTGGAT